MDNWAPKYDSVNLNFDLYNRQLRPDLELTPQIAFKSPSSHILQHNYNHLVIKKVPTRIWCHDLTFYKPERYSTS